MSSGSNLTHAIKLLLDQGVPLTAAGDLRQTGLDAVHTAEIGMSRSKDADILARADAEGRVVVTLDADFHAILAHSGSGSPSVIRLRAQGLNGPTAARLIIMVVERFRSEIEGGAMVTVRDMRVRVRPLPLLGRHT